ncbi:MAG: ABC transporter substrate-binding protein [Deltaproteobacteria bacterium]|nr:ABC transporter substrate-binding protein [Deltaproteobacteria bacterium]
MKPHFIVDDLGRRVALDPVPRRILSLIPSVTEFLFDVGLGARAVGRTSFCISPEECRPLPAVGGPKTVDLELVRALRPDLILANAEENRRDQVEALLSEGFRVHVAFPRDLGGAARLLRSLGELLGVPAPAEALARELEGVSAPPPGPRPRCACLIWKDPYMTATRETLTSALLEAAGASNAFAELPGRYPRVEVEELVAASPAAILLPSEPYPFGEADAAELEALVPSAALLRVPGEWVTWYGSRMANSIAALRRVLDPLRVAA